VSSGRISRMTAAAITLRLAQAQDAPALAMMSRDLVEHGLDWRYRPSHIGRLIADRDTITLVACDQGRRIGFAIMAFSDEHAHLVLLAVKPSHRRLGIGRRMMDWLLRSALTAGIASLHLELRANNDGARAFYRTLGFSETIVLDGYYDHREAALRMLRVLRASS
jgi:ribosomal protein S18 acetylase RimI-like enzyme